MNAAIHLKDAGGLAFECYLSKAFKILTEQVVREDFTAFLGIVETTMCTSSLSGSQTCKNRVENIETSINRSSDESICI